MLFLHVTSAVIFIVVITAEISYFATGMKENVISDYMLSVHFHLVVLQKLNEIVFN